MKIGEFGKSLKLWRGKRLQKEAADVLDVNLRTYEGWENGRKPGRYAINEIKRRMASNPDSDYAWKYPPKKQIWKPLTA
jgi:hypothetical protein